MDYLSVIKHPILSELTDFVELFNYCKSLHFLAVNGSWNTLFKMNGNICRLIGSLKRRNSEFKESRLFILRFICRILKVKTFVGKMPEILIL